MHGRRGVLCAVVAAALLVAVELVQWTVKAPEFATARLVLVLAFALPGCALAAIYLAFLEDVWPLPVTMLAVTTFGFYALGTVYDLTQVDLWSWVHALGAVAMILVGWYSRGWSRWLAWVTAGLFVAATTWAWLQPTWGQSATAAAAQARQAAKDAWGLWNHFLVSASWVVASFWLALLPWWLRRGAGAADEAAAVQSR